MSKKYCDRIRKWCACLIAMFCMISCAVPMPYAYSFVAGMGAHTIATKVGLSKQERADFVKEVNQGEKIREEISREAFITRVSVFLASVLTYPQWLMADLSDKPNNFARPLQRSNALLKVGSVPEEEIYGALKGTLDAGPNGEPKVYNVIRNIWVNAGETLIIKPNVTINFHTTQYVTFDVAGKLEVLGEKDKPVIFTSETAWQGIRFYGSAAATFYYTEIDRVSLLGYNHPFFLVEEDSMVTFNNTMIHNCYHGPNETALFNVLGVLSFYHSNIYDNQAKYLFNVIGSTARLHCEKTLITNNNSLNREFWLDREVGLVKGSNTTFINCTVSENGRDDPLFNYPNGLFFGQANFINTIVYDNFGNAVGGKGFSEGTTINFSSIQDGSLYPAWQNGIGNIDASPLFVAPKDRDYHLQSGSPCINTGDPSLPLDPDGTSSDMGAFYYGNDTGIVVVDPYELRIYPNPCTAADGTTFQFELDRAAKCQIKVIDMNGRVIETIMHQGESGINSIFWKPKPGAPTGAFVIRLQVAGKVESTRKIIVEGAAIAVLGRRTFFKIFEERLELKNEQSLSIIAVFRSA